MDKVTHNKIGFCALEYRHQGENLDDSANPILILIVRTPQKSAHVLVNPVWRSIVVP